MGVSFADDTALINTSIGLSTLRGLSFISGMRNILSG